MIVLKVQHAKIFLVATLVNVRQDMRETRKIMEQDAVKNQGKSSC